MEKDVQYPQEKEQWLPTMVTVITMGMTDNAGCLQWVSYTQLVYVGLHYGSMRF